MHVHVCVYYTLSLRSGIAIFSYKPNRLQYNNLKYMSPIHTNGDQLLSSFWLPGPVFILDSYATILLKASCVFIVCE